MIRSSFSVNLYVPDLRSGLAHVAPRFPGIVRAEDPSAVGGRIHPLPLPRVDRERMERQVGESLVHAPPSPAAIRGTVDAGHVPRCVDGVRRGWIECHGI